MNMHETTDILSDDTEEKLQTVMDRVNRVMTRFPELTKAEAFQILGLVYQETAERRGKLWGFVWKSIKAGVSALVGELNKVKVE